MVLAFGLAVPLHVFAFSDVPPDHPSFAAINFLEAEGVVRGYKDGFFRPQRTLNRAEFVAIVVQATDTKEEITTCFDQRESLFADTPFNTWYAPFVCRSLVRGLVTGYGDGTFRPMGIVTAGEAAKILTKAFGLEIPLLEQGIGGVRARQFWWKPYLAALHERGALPENVESPHAPVTRAQMAEMLYILLKPPSMSLLHANPSIVKPDAEVIDVEALLKGRSIPTGSRHIVAFSTDDAGKHFAVLLGADTGKEFFLYVNDTLVRHGTWDREIVPIIFTVTGNGHVISSIEPTELYMDGTRISSPDNMYRYGAGKDGVYVSNGRVVYVDGKSIRSWKMISGGSELLYRHPEGEIHYMRMRDEDVVYTLIIGKDAYLYKNGAKISPSPINNPENFLLARNRNVYAFREEAGSYIVLRNDEEIFRSEGKPGFLYEDAQGTIWHAGYTVLDDKKSVIDVKLYRGSRRVVPELAIGNIEGVIGVPQGISSAYAVRVSLRGDKDPFLFRLLHNGEIVGEPFAFGNPRDTGGIAMLQDGTAFLRSYDKGHWVLTRNGLPYLTHLTQDVWAFHAGKQRLRVYASLRKS
jgi:hypothetical protein